LFRVFKSKIRTAIQQNIKIGILIISVFAVGFFLALLCGMESAQEEEIKLYFTDFVLNVTESGTDAVKIFYLSMLNYIKFALILFFASVTVIGVPAVLVYTLFKGFSFGMVIGCLFKAFGARAFLVILSAVLPHLFISSVCCLAYTACCMKNACGLTAANGNLKKILIKPLLCGILFLCAVSIAALIQAYIEPLMIRFISSSLV